MTIKELSAELGVSKVGLSKWIDRNGYKEQLQLVGNRYEIPDDLEKTIRSKFSFRGHKTKETINRTSEPEKAVTSEILGVLREQLEVKDREIERLHEEIARLQESLEHIQQANVDTLKALREANALQALQLTEGTVGVHAEDPAEEHREISEKRRSFWDRLRGKRV